ncbi:MAG TPA: DUF1206 domain-containing protein [Gemmatimonadales bacterium]|nr:DUF1206 domain-containing protein [Gemmatimonadales bacterium]
MTDLPLPPARWVDRFARAGYAAKGVVYLLIGVLAVQAAAGAGGRTTGTSGALHVLLRQPFGRGILALVAVGLAGYAAWRLYCAAVDPKHPGRRDWKRAAVRVGYSLSALVHGGLAWQAARLALGQSGGGGDGQTDQRTAQLMAVPFGQWLVGILALGVVAYGVAQIVKGVRGRGVEATQGTDLQMQRALERAAQIGLIARGIVFGMMGLFLGRAALQHDPSEAGGLKEALQELARQPYAPVLLGGVALGLAAYGAYQLALARWAAVPTA